MNRRWAAVLLALLAAGCTQPTSLSHFDSEGISFDYPATWNAATYRYDTNFRWWIVFLSTGALRDPCDRTSQPPECRQSPMAGPLAANGVYATWTSNGWMSWQFKSNAGESIRVGNVQSTLEVLDAPDWCLAMAATTYVRVITPGAAANGWTEMDACINGPFAGSIEAQIRAMLDSVKWN